MILNHIEILTAKWLNYQGYITQNRIPFWLPREKTGKQPQWSDIDVLAIKNDEVKFVECKAFLGVAPKERVVKKIEEHFKIASEYIVDIYPWLKNKRKTFLVVAEAPKNLQSYKTLLGDNIELKHFKEVIEGVLKHLRTKLPPDKYKGAIGYGIKEEEENMCRLLLTLLSYGFIK